MKKRPKPLFVILDPRSGQAARNNVPRRRAGSEIFLFQPRPAEKKKKPAHKSGLSPIFFARPRTTLKIFSPTPHFRARRREMILIVNSDDMRVRIYTLRGARVEGTEARSAAKPHQKRGRQRRPLF